MQISVFLLLAAFLLPPSVSCRTVTSAQEEPPKSSQGGQPAPAPPAAPAPEPPRQQPGSTGDVPEPRSETPPPAERSSSLLETVRSLGARPLDEIWPGIEELKRSLRNGGSGELRLLADHVNELDERAKLAGAALLSSRGESAFNVKGQVALEQLAQHGKDKATRITAIRLLREPVRSLWDAAYLVLQGIVDTAEDPEIVIEASLSLWQLDNYPPHRQPLIRLLDEAKPSIRYAAALALAETGYFLETVPEILERIRDEPSERGKRAGLLLSLFRKEEDRFPPEARGDSTRGERSKDLPGGRDAGAEGEPRGKPKATARERPTGEVFRDWCTAVEEVVRAILENSVHQKEVDLKRLYVAALRGMASSLDAYSAFLDADDFQYLEENQLGIHWGLGVQLLKSEGGSPLVVAKVHYGGPAYAAGLRSGDRILEVDGVPTHSASLRDLKDLTKGEKGTEVHLLAERWNEPQPRMVSVRRGEVEVPSIRVELLPEGIGYVKILRFAQRAAEEFERILDGLESQGLNALVLDLRGNPGGRLEEAVKIVDLFVGERPQPIVVEQGPRGGKEWLPDAEEKPRHPTLVLVDGSTASSAEVVAAALQDFQRATIIGQRTFGKGVKQTSLPLSPLLQRLLGGEGSLLLTTSYLYSPLGRPIHVEPVERRRSRPGRSGGVTPDIQIGEVEERLDERRITERLRVEFSPLVSRFVADRYPRIRGLLEARTPWNPASEDGFAQLVESLDAALTEAEIRRAVRAAAVRAFEDERGREMTANFSEDPELSRAILEALARLGRNPREVPVYRRIGERPPEPRSR